MKLLKYIFFLILIIIIGGSLYLATKNGDYDISRERIIKAPSEVIFNNVNDYKNWAKWGPWYEMDSTITTTYPENTIGKDASYSWKDASGGGSMKTIEVDNNKSLLQEIAFNTPLGESKSNISWNFNKVDEGTEVTWGMKGTHNFMDKAYFLISGTNFENMMNDMFDRGLELLDLNIQSDLEKHSVEIKGIIDHGGGYYLYQSTACKQDQIGAKMGTMFNSVIKYMADNNIEASGKPFSLTHKWDEVNKTTVFSTCVPVNERIITNGDVLTGYLKPQKCFKAIALGDYKFLEESWNAVFKAMEEENIIFIETVEPFEVYVVSTHEEPNPSKWVTDIYVPIE